METTGLYREYIGVMYGIMEYRVLINTGQNDPSM